MSKSKKGRLETLNLRSVQGLSAASELVFNRQLQGSLDAKGADALNTTIKNSVYLVAKLPMDIAKLYIQARIKKLSLPDTIFPIRLQLKAGQ